MIKTKLNRRTVLGAAGASLLAAPAFGQGAFPNKPLKMIVPYPPGGGTDGLGRITGQFLSEKLGQPIVIQNIGGASGTVGSDSVRRADPDGYTLLFNASLFVLGKAVVPSCPYDAQTDFRPIAQAGEAPLVLLANNDVPGNDYASMMAAIAKEPKKYFFALSSGGSAGHIATLAFLKRTKLPLDTILYKGTAPANTDLMSGAVQLFMDPWTALLPLATSGRAKGVFVTSKERTPLAPNIPTTSEVGLKDFNLSSWYGAWAPKETPDAVVNRLAAGMAEVSKDPNFIAKTTSLGIVPTARGPKEFAAFIKEEVETNTALLKDAGFKPE
ncbi:tripartite tricarboxylate transporter substrate binding protein [Reyranella sp.]|uniref:Bug family tripartite tricarboxylate transporter substrate binding protein n=1 Tax=Reyranella sp. TaxID=1929291 RepID=UPI00272F15C3|nr:tripartite tricarboxylate transporter substrate binding protein [Reyranella sp.]MDP2374178.1 tripartite tricarboxylate transporter substrate binding protein [Reyranella sp.]